MRIRIDLRQVGLLVVTSFALVAVDVPTKSPGLEKMECHLHVAERSNSDPGEFTGEFTLKNTSSEPIKIEYLCHPLTYLDLDVKDENGKILPKSLKAYGDIFSSVKFHPQMLTLNSGETYRKRVVLFEQVDKKKHPIRPGKYTVEAIYKWKPPGGTTLTVKSHKVTIEVTAK